MSSYESVANGLFLKGDIEAAKQGHIKALEICKKIYGEDHYKYAAILTNLSNARRD